MFNYKCESPLVCKLSRIRPLYFYLICIRDERSSSVRLLKCHGHVFQVLHYLSEHKNLSKGTKLVYFTLDQEDWCLWCYHHTVLISLHESLFLITSGPEYLRRDISVPFVESSCVNNGTLYSLEVYVWVLVV